MLLRDGLVSFGPSPMIVKEGAEWIQTHTPANASVYTNSLQLAYYSKRPGMNLNGFLSEPVLAKTLNHDKWKQYNYLALYVKRKDKIQSN